MIFLYLSCLVLAFDAWYYLLLVCVTRTYVTALGRYSYSTRRHITNRSGTDQDRDHDQEQDKDKARNQSETQFGERIQVFYGRAAARRRVHACAGGVNGTLIFEMFWRSVDR